MHRMIKIGVFDDVVKAQRAVADAVAAGVPEKDITVFLSEDEEEPMVPIQAKYVIHPSDATARSHFGGGVGGAIGGFFGSLAMYLFTVQGTLSSLAFSFFIGSLIGASAATLLARHVPGLTWFLAILSPRRQAVHAEHSHDYDRWRSELGAEIGAAFGTLAGTLASYLIGIPSLWYFVTTGLWAAAVSIIFGGLVGAMCGRGLAPSGMGPWEDLVDAGENVMVSVDCTDSNQCMLDVEELLRRDGATLIRTA